MDFFFEIGNRYAKKSNWKDFAFVKFCLCAMGVMIGLCIPDKEKKMVGGFAAGVFICTYIPLMSKVARVIKDMLEERA